MHRRDFLGLLAAVAACGLPVTAQASLPAPTAPPLPEKPDRQPPVATRGKRPPADWEDRIRACLGDAIAVDVSCEASMAGWTAYRIVYVKRESRVVEHREFQAMRMLAERGRIRYCEVRQDSLYDPPDIGVSRSHGRRFVASATKTSLVIEWVIA